MINDLLHKLQSVDPLVWAALAAYFAPYVQHALNKVRDFGRSSNYVIALIVVPLVIAALTALPNSELLASLNPTLKVVLTATFAAVVSQLKYGLSLKPKLDTKQELEQLRSALNIGTVAADEPVAVVSPVVEPEPEPEEEPQEAY